MSELLRLTCTISDKDYNENNLFLRSYFPVSVITRDGKVYKYYSLVTRNSLHTIMQALEKELKELYIDNYSFNISTDWNLSSVEQG